MKTNHSQSPWRVGDEIVPTIISADGRQVAKLNYYISNDTGEYPSHKTQWEANARLIASSPELLSCLVKILNWHKAHDAISFLETEAIKEAEQVIAKATGEPINS